MTDTQDFSQHTSSQPDPGGKPRDPVGEAPGGRSICNALHLFRICPRQTCRRAGGCRGNGLDCIRRHAQIVPEEVWDWVEVVVAGDEDGLTNEEIMEEAEPHKGAYLAWVIGVETGASARRDE